MGWKSIGRGCLCGWFGFGFGRSCDCVQGCRFERCRSITNFDREWFFPLIRSMSGSEYRLVDISRVTLYSWTSSSWVISMWQSKKSESSLQAVDEESKGSVLHVAELNFLVVIIVGTVCVYVYYSIIPPNIISFEASCVSSLSTWRTPTHAQEKIIIPKGHFWFSRRHANTNDSTTHYTWKLAPLDFLASKALHAPHLQRGLPQRKIRWCRCSGWNMYVHIVGVW